MKIFSFILSSLSFYMSLCAIFNLISFYEHPFQEKEKKKDNKRHVSSNFSLDKL